MILFNTGSGIMVRDTKYRSLFETLKANVLSGKYGNGKAFPSVRALIRRHGLSNSTVLHALDELVRQGLICREQGRGTFVVDRGASRRIGLIVPGVAYSEFFPPIVSRISCLSQKEGFHLLFGDIASKSPRLRVREARRFAKDLVGQGVAGVLYQPMELVDDGERVNREILSIFDRAHIPVVILDNDFLQSPHRGGYDVVGIDNVAAGAIVAEHLIGCGVERISFQKRSLCSASVNARLRGVISTLPVGRCHVACNILEAEPDDVAAVRRHLRTCKPDAFVCGNDTAAVALKQTLETLGRRVPDDIMLVGFDDVRFAKIVSPPLTTIHQPCDLIGETAFDRLLERINDPSLAPLSLLLPIELVVRGSTKNVVRNMARSGSSLGATSKCSSRKRKVKSNVTNKA